MAEDLRIFSYVATAIFLEAMPFLALGALISAIVEVFVSPTRLARVLPRRFASGVALGILAGLVVPTCECGVVPVARRLLLKGTPSAIVIAYLLTAPIVNPVVLVSTFVAFRGDLSMLFGRVGIAVIVAVTVAYLVRRTSPGDLLSRRAREEPRASPPDPCCPAESDEVPEARSKAARVLLHAAHDFLEMGKYLVLGAVVAGLFKTFVPQEALAAFEGRPLLSIFGMMGLAVLLSVCSEADAFVAASFVSFPAAAHLAFVTIGPMLDLKLIALYGASFRRRIFLVLLVVPFALVFLLTAIYGWLT